MGTGRALRRVARAAIAALRTVAVVPAGFTVFAPSEAVLLGASEDVVRRNGSERVDAPLGGRLLARRTRPGPPVAT